MATPPDGALVYVADDDDGVRRSLDMLLDGAGYRVEAFPSGEDMLAAMAAGGRPACAVVDVRMGDGRMDGLDVQRELTAAGVPPIPVIIVTAHADVPLAVAAMRLGVTNFLEKPYPPDDLLDAVAEAIAATPPAPDLPTLTPRERAVLEALIFGRSNKEIAREMGISHRTVEVHRASLMTRLRARSLADAVRMGLAAGLGQGAS